MVKRRISAETTILGGIYMPVHFVARIVLLITTIVSVLFPQDVAAKIISVILLSFTLYVACFRKC